MDGVSHSWYSYLAPLGMLAPTHEPVKQLSQHLAKQSMHATEGPAGAGKARPAFSDITNNDVLAKALPDKVKGARQLQLPTQQHSQQHSQGAHTRLPQQNFSDPSLIDAGLSQAEKAACNWIDVDATNLDDPQACAPYAAAIFQHLREAEKLRRPNPAYLDQFQNDMNSKMRAILVDWLVEVAEEYKLCADTLYLTVNYIDRFLSRHMVQRSQLQLVGVACMWVAAKYEEIYPPNVTDFCYITDSTYSKEQMVMMEETVLKKLAYELTVPTAKTFLRRLLQVCNPDELLHFLSNYLTELSLLDHIMMQFLASQIAAAAVYLSNLMLRRPAWDGNLQHFSTYVPHDILPCVRALALLHQAVSSNAQLAAIREKYASPRFQSVSRVPISNTLMQQLGI